MKGILIILLLSTMHFAGIASAGTPDRQQTESWLGAVLNTSHANVNERLMVLEKAKAEHKYEKSAMEALPEASDTRNPSADHPHAHMAVWPSGEMLHYIPHS